MFTHFPSNMEDSDVNMLHAFILNVSPWALLQEGSLPKITVPGRGRAPFTDLDSDQDSGRTDGSGTRRGQAKLRRHTLPPILPDPER